MSRQSSKIRLEENWLMCSSSQVAEAAEAVAAPGLDVSGWYPVAVPTTVLNALVKNGVYPDPRIGLNNFLIPDASEEFNAEHGLSQYSYLPDKRNPWKDPYWFRTEFLLPEASGSRHWLVFQAINYRAEVWLNGKQIAAASDMVGTFLRFRYDVTEAVRPGERNVLAVKVHGVDHPGIPGTQLTPFQPPRTARPAEEDDIMRDVTINIAAVGYDCAPEVRDRMMGIWQEVYLKATGPVAIRDPFVKTKLPLPRTDRARLTISAELVNASEVAQQGVLKGRIGETIAFERRVELAPGEQTEVVFAPEEYPQLVVEDPLLWWPRGYGEQHLHQLTLCFETAEGVSDEEQVRFGIREVTKVLHEVQGEYGLRLHVNGQRIFCRGGYLMLDTLLDGELLGRERLEAEFRYLAEANLNTFSMEDVPNPPEVFFDLCDEYGLLYWNCYFQCHWLEREEYPLDHELLERCAVDVTKRYRNHPSIVAYMCMNEGATAEDQYARWRRSVLEHDGTRIMIPSGYGDYYDRTSWPEWIRPDLPVGANDNYPKSYTWKPHSWYYSMVRDDRTWMFKIESGSASLPPIASLREFLPDLGEAEAGAPFPLTRTWAHHGVNEYYRDYDRAIRRRFGEPETVEEYSWCGHVVTADQHRAMFEAVHHLKWEVTSGFMQWKLNSCWPDVQWQLYDYFLRPMVSQYYIKRACEPRHVQLNPISNMVTVINHTLRPTGPLTVQASVYDFEMKTVWEQSQELVVGADCYQDVFALPHLSGLTAVYFVKLVLREAEGRPVSDNFYWLSSRPGVDDTGCFADLKRLPQAEVRVTHSYVEQGEEGVVQVAVDNPTDALAFFLHLRVTRDSDGAEVLPVYWEDNYFSLLPGERRKVAARFPRAALKGSRPEVKVGGWNVRGN